MSNCLHIAQTMRKSITTWVLPCTISAGLTKHCNVSVEKESELTLGHTAVDYWHVTQRPHNVDWASSIDAAGFYELLVGRLARFGDS